MDNPPARTLDTRWMEGLDPLQRRLFELTLQLCLRPDVRDLLEEAHRLADVPPAHVTLLAELLYAAQQIALAQGRTPAVLLPRPPSMGGHDHD